MQTTSCRSMFGFMFLRVVPGIRNHVRASCMAIINTNSKSKRKDDIGVIFHILASFSCISVFGAVAIPGWRVSLTNGYHWGSLLVMNFPVCIATVSFIMVADLQAGITLCFFPIKHTGHRRGSCQLHHSHLPCHRHQGLCWGWGVMASEAMVVTPGLDLPGFWKERVYLGHKCYFPWGQDPYVCFPGVLWKDPVTILLSYFRY